MVGTDARPPREASVGRVNWRQSWDWTPGTPTWDACISVASLSWQCQPPISGTSEIIFPLLFGPWRVTEVADTEFCFNYQERRGSIVASLSFKTKGSHIHHESPRLAKKTAAFICVNTESTSCIFHI